MISPSEGAETQGCSSSKRQRVSINKASSPTGIRSTRPECWGEDNRGAHGHEDPGTPPGMGPRPQDPTLEWLWEGARKLGLCQGGDTSWVLGVLQGAMLQMGPWRLDDAAAPERVSVNDPS